MQRGKGCAGITTGEILIVLVVILLFFAITIPVYRRVNGSTLESIDAARMRQVYVALTLYEEANNGQPSGNQLGAREYLKDDSLFLSNSDPWAVEHFPQYPVDAELPTFQVTSPVRLSFSYLPDFVFANKTTIKNWRDTMIDPRVGLLACGWQGTVVPTSDPFAATLSGPVLRINMNGSLFRLNQRSGGMGDVKSLFYDR